MLELLNQLDGFDSMSEVKVRRGAEGRGGEAWHPALRGRRVREALLLCRAGHGTPGWEAPLFCWAGQNVTMLLHEGSLPPPNLIPPAPPPSLILT